MPGRGGGILTNGGRACGQLRNWRRYSRGCRKSGAGRRGRIFRYRRLSRAFSNRGRKGRRLHGELFGSRILSIPNFLRMIQCASKSKGPTRQDLRKGVGRRGGACPKSHRPVVLGRNWLCKMPYCMGFSRQAETNEKGEYSVTGLDVPGAWLLSAVAPSSRKPVESRDDRRLGWAQTR